MIKKLLLVFLLTYPQLLNSSVEVDFNIWLNKFKITALKKGISEETINNSFKNTKYLKQVIKYDRYQPEFFEDTKTYINKRATRSRMLKAKALLKKNQKLLDEVEKKINKPVFSSNQTLIWDTIRSVGYKSSIEGYGKLLRN